MIDTAKDVQLFRLRDLFDDAASEYTGALIINEISLMDQIELPYDYLGNSIKLLLNYDRMG